MYAVLFDIDGTLLKTGGAGKHAFLETFLEDFNCQMPLDGIAFAGRSDRAIAEEIMEVTGLGATAENWQKFREGYLSRLSDKLTALEGEVLPGVHNLINSLEKYDHVLIGLLTGNLQEGAYKKLAHYEIDQHFEFGGFGDTHPDRNDIASDAKSAAIEYLSTSGGNNLQKVMVIGDTLNDIRCARAIDAYAVAVATGGNSLEELQAQSPDLLLSDLSDHQCLIDEINSVANHNAA